MKDVEKFRTSFIRVNLRVLREKHLFQCPPSVILFFRSPAARTRMPSRLLSPAGGLSFRAKHCPLVISSEARSAESRNLPNVRVNKTKKSPMTDSRSLHALSRDDKSGISSAAALLSMPTKHAPCQFERSTKCEVEKSAPQFCLCKTFVFRANH